MNRFGGSSLLLIFLFTAVFFLAGYGIPIARELAAGVGAVVRETLPVREFAGDLVPIFLMTALQALASVLAAGAFAVALGFVLDRVRTERGGEALFPWLVSVLRGTFYLPTLTAIHLTLWLLGGTNFRYGFFAVVLAHFILNAGWLSIEASEAFRTLPRAEIAVARTLGASRFRALRDFAVPAFLLRMRDPLLITFSLCFSSFTIVLLLGGGPPVQTLETEMYAALRLGASSDSRRLVIFLLQAAVGVTLAWATCGSLNRAVNTNFVSRSPVPKLTMTRTPKVVGYLLSAAALTGILYFVATSGFSRLWSDPSFRDSVRLSWRIAIGTSLLVTGICFAFVGSARLVHPTARFAAFLGGLSPFLIAAAFLRTYSALDRAEAGTALVALILLSGLVQIPFQFRFLSAWRMAENFSDFEMARSLGASRLRAARDFLWPRWKWIALALLASSFFFGFTESAVSFLYGGADAVPFSVWIARSESRYAFADARAAQASLVFLWLLLIALQSFCFSEAHKENG